MHESSFTTIRRPTTLSYLAGLLEGDGSFMRPSPSTPNQPAVALAMTDEDVVRRAATLLETGVYTLGRRQAHHKDVFSLRVRGRRAVEVMTALKPLMASRRQEQITAALSARSLGAPRHPYATEVVEMIWLKARGIPRQELAERYSVTPKSIDKLVRGAERPLGRVFSQAGAVEMAEGAISQAADGDLQLAWLIGLLEAEAHFGRSGIGVHGMIDRDVIDHVAAITGSRIAYLPPRRQNCSPAWQATIGRRRSFELVARISSGFGSRRQSQIAGMLRLIERPAAAGNPSYREPLHRRGWVPPERRARNMEIARRLAAGESGPALAREFGMTHQNVYNIAKHYPVACPSG